VKEVKSACVKKEKTIEMKKGEMHILENSTIFLLLLIISAGIKKI